MLRFIASQKVITALWCVLKKERNTFKPPPEWKLSVVRFSPHHLPLSNEGQEGDTRSALFVLLSSSLLYFLNHSCYFPHILDDAASYNRPNGALSLRTEARPVLWELSVFLNQDSFSVYCSQGFYQEPD